MPRLFSKLILKCKNSWQARSILALLLVLLLGMAGFSYLSHYTLNTPIGQNGRLYLPKHASARFLTQTLYQAGAIQHPFWFRMLLRQQRWASQLKPGTYLYSSKDSLTQLMRRIIKGEVLTLPLTIIEGSQLCDLIANLSHAKDYQFQAEMLAALPQDHSSLEGLFFPSTYVQPYGESVLAVLQLAYQTLQKNLAQVWGARDPNLPYQTSYELLIAASIIEKETADPKERPLISAVIRNRLQRGMRLQMDPTVAYGMPGCQHRVLKGSDLKYDSPYNTYMHAGLPPTPIAMVSMASLEAAAHPAKSDYLYFVAKGDGHHAFSRNYFNQQKAVNMYLRTKHD